MTGGHSIPSPGQLYYYCCCWLPWASDIRRNHWKMFMDLPVSKIIPFLCSFCGYWERKVTCITFQLHGEVRQLEGGAVIFCHVFSLSKGDKISSLL